MTTRGRSRLLVLLRGFVLVSVVSGAFGLSQTSAIAADSPAPFLWEVKGPLTTHYLLGSVHLLPESADKLPEGIADAYDAADGLVFESDIGTLSSPKSGLSLVASAKAPRGLKGEVDPALYARVQARIAKLKVPATLCDQYKAWFCALTLEIYAYQKAGFTGEHGLDRQLYELGKADGKAMSWFESPTTHLGLFTGMDDSLGKQLLTAELVEDGATPEDPATMLKAWRDNDTSKIEALIADMKSRYPQVYEHLLANRNRAWAKRLKQLLDGDVPQLIVVGAAHWLGPEGLLAQLKAEGYRVEPYVVKGPELITAMPHGPVLITAASLAGIAAPGR